MLERICRVLGVTPNYLLGFASEKDGRSAEEALKMRISNAEASMGEAALRRAVAVI